MNASAIVRRGAIGDLIAGAIFLTGIRVRSALSGESAFSEIGEIRA